MRGQLTYHSGRAVANTFDPRSRLASVFDNATLSNGVRWDFDAANRRQSAIFSKTGQPARGESAFEYDRDNRVTGVQHGNRISGVLDPFYDVGYGYDPVGNRLYKPDLVETERSEVYTYDQRHRLTGFERGEIEVAGGLASVTEAINDPEMPAHQNWMPTGTTGLDSRGNWRDFASTIAGQTATQARSLEEAGGGGGCANEYERIDMTLGTQQQSSS